MNRPLFGLALAAIVSQAPAIAQVRIEALGTLPAASITVGSAISGDGSTVGGFAAGVGAVRWSKSTGWQPLTALSAGQSSYAAGVSDDGSIVAGAITSGSSSRGFRWSSVTGVIDIGSMTVDDLS